MKKLANKLNNLTIVKKGKIDIISDGKGLLTNDMDGSLKRCGGIGDLLSGAIGTFSYWAHIGIDQEIKNKSSKNDAAYEYNQPCLIASYAACALVKECSLSAFKIYHRSVLADDVVKEIPNQLFILFDKDNS